MPGTLKLKKIGIIGFGRSGKAITRLLTSQGIYVKVSEKKEIGRECLREFRGLIASEVGKHTLEFFKDVDLVVVSPGVSPHSEIISSLTKTGKPIYTEFEIALMFLKGSKVIAVTGTNGKSTVVRLLETIFLKAGLDAVACGNIGVPVSEIVLSGRVPQYIILEVSSFQLWYSRGFAPEIGVFLNFAQDHLDYHIDPAEYLEAKWDLFRLQTPSQWAVLNSSIMEEGRIGGLKGRMVPFGMEGDNEFLSCGFMRKGSIWVRIQGNEEEICRIEDIPLYGRHNVENVVAGSVVARITGIPADIIKEGIRGFRGLPYRLQDMGLIDGIRFINDSKSTNLHSTIAAIDSFDSPIVLILGGIYKAGKMDRLKEMIRKKVKHIVLFGRSKDLFLRSLSGIVPVTLSDSLQEAVGNAIRYASCGDVILFSPACSSFDMFEDYIERGKEFNRIVEGFRLSTLSYL